MNNPLDREFIPPLPRIRTFNRKAETSGSCCGDPPHEDLAAESLMRTDCCARAKGNDQEARQRSWQDYLPLVVIVLLTLASACAKQAGGVGGWNWMSWMHDFMGFFLVVFSMFKFFDLRGFADGFQRYDLLARKSRGYAYVYPFLELGLGLGYLSMVMPLVVYVATMALMSFGALGVLVALRKRHQLNCACLGSTLKVPLSAVALAEDVGMAVMAAMMLVAR